MPLAAAVFRILLPTYVYDPETVKRPERAKQFYGRAMPIHYERAGKRPDTFGMFGARPLTEMGQEWIGGLWDGVSAKSNPI